MDTITAMTGMDEEDVVDFHGEIDLDSLDSGDDDDPMGVVPAEEEEPTPTTESASETAETTDEDGSTAPTTESAEQPASDSLSFKAKIDHNEIDVAIQPSDLPTLFQKAQNHDRMSKRHDEMNANLQKYEGMAKALGYESLEAMLKSASESSRTRQVEELVEGGTAQEIAEFYVDSKMSANKDSAPKADVPKNEENMFAAQVDELYSARPDLKGTLKRLPDEVTKAVLDGNKSLLTAYTEWESKQLQAENQRLKNERNVLKQQADAASRSPVRGTTTTGAPSAGAENPMFIGFGDIY